MRDKNHQFEQLWSREAFGHWTGRRWLIDRSEEVPRIVVPLDCLVEDIASSKGDQFSIRKGRHGGLIVSSSPLGKRILDCARRLDIDLVRRCLPRHRFSPFFELWESQRNPVFELGLGPPSPSMVPGMNAWLAFIRTQARCSPFHDAVRKQERAALKNAVGTRKYLQSLWRHHSRLLVVRVDVGYRNDPEEFGNSWAPQPDAQVKEHLAKQIRFMQRGVKPLIGYVWKIEYGAARGHHCHLMALLDGHLAREGITWGDAIGKNWLEVTQGIGSAWNCNKDAEYYARRGLLGIGQINYDDLDAQRNLMRTAMYLAKSDYYARFASPDIARTFGKGELKGEPSGRGRPRKYSDASETARSQPAAPPTPSQIVAEIIKRGQQQTDSA